MVSMPTRISFATARRDDARALRDLLATMPGEIAREIFVALTLQPDLVTVKTYDARSETAVFLLASTTIVKVWSLQPLSSREFVAIGALVDRNNELDPALAGRICELAMGREAS